MKRKLHTLSYLLTPDYLFDRFDQVTPEFLSSLGIRGLLIDIDNTLAPYEEPEPNERVRKWVHDMRESGVTVILVSNNHAPRVERFNRELGLLAFHDCHKPSKKRLLRIAEKGGAALSETAALGDQVFTDVWGARMIGVRAILVPPIRDKKTLFFRFKRALEAPILRRFHKKER